MRQGQDIKAKYGAPHPAFQATFPLWEKGKISKPYFHFISFSHGEKVPDRGDEGFRCLLTAPKTQRQILTLWPMA